MIEIIRQEDAGQGAGTRELPKDIKQIGTPDIGDRIYVEDGAYQALHPYGSMEEKRAYVLLGKMENCSGRQCVFVEAVIPLPEMEFDGEMPLWNDHTWAYIYKQLKREYDSMVIVGWAMDIKGQLPNMTARLENLHRNNFGGAHQLLFLMDSLEREEAFYANRSGHLYRRDGFYIYYDKGKAKTREKQRFEADLTRADVNEWKARTGFEGSISIESGASDEQERNFGENEKSFAGHEGFGEHEKSFGENEKSFAEHEGFGEQRKGFEEHGKSFAEHEGFGEHEKSFEERMRMDEPVSFSRNAETKERGYDGEETSGKIFKTLGLFGENRGQYRRQITEQEETKRTPSYASTLLLAMVVCALGVTAYLNHEKMVAMEETIAQMRQTSAVSTEQTTEQTEGTELAEEMPAVQVENVAGNVQKQDGTDGTAQTGTDAVGGAQTADASAQTASASAGTAAGGTAQSGAADAAAGTTSASAETTAADGTSQAGGNTAAGTDSTSQNGAANAAGTSSASAGTTAVADGTSQAGGDTAAADSTAQTDTTAAMTEAQTYLNQGYYVVQKGDSLVGICRKIYQTTAMMDKLCEVNGIEDQDAIYAGQYLTLP